MFAAILISVLVMVLSPTAFAVPSLLNGIPFLRGNVPAQISAVHILFNVLLTIVFLPLSGAIIKLTKLILPDVDEEKEKMETVYLDTRILTTPPMAVLSVENECKRLGELARKNYTYAMQAFFEGDARLIEKVEKTEETLREKDELIKQVSEGINTPLNVLSGYTQILSSTDMELSDDERKKMKQDITTNTDLIITLIKKLQMPES
jgi:phosphate:Na+ symporter